MILAYLLSAQEKENKVDRARILIIEDDVENSIYLQEFLEECSFFVDSFDNVTDAIARIGYRKYDLIILDLNLPDYDGYEVLKFLNQESYRIPVIVLSAYSELENKLKAFRLGASDYIVKPIDPNELEARMWVHLGKSSKFKKTILKTRFDIINQEIYLKDKALPLTKTEFRILKVLVENFGSTVPREKLTEELSKKSSDRSLDGHIKNIRKKIESFDLNGEIMLTTEYGHGYRLHN